MNTKKCSKINTFLKNKLGVIGKIIILVSKCPKLIPEPTKNMLLIKKKDLKRYACETERCRKRRTTSIYSHTDLLLGSF